MTKMEDLGMWVSDKPPKMGAFYASDLHCSNCNWNIHHALMVSDIPTNFCPKCGKKMISDHFFEASEL